MAVRDEEKDAHSGMVMRCIPVKKQEVTLYAGASNYPIMDGVRPTPFTGECWMFSDHLRDHDHIPGYLGDVFVGYPDIHTGHRLF